MDSASLFTDKFDTKFGVSIFYGEDGCYRFIPLVRNRFGVYVPIEEGVEIPPTTDAEQIGNGYITAAVNSLNHYGEDLDMRKAPALYKSFKKFTSQKKFDSTHCKVSSIAKDSEIKFTYTVWHKGEFCLKKGDPIIEKVIPRNNSATEIGNTILNMFIQAQNIFPKNEILSTALSSGNKES